MAKDLNISRLCDAYGSLLTEHMRDVIRNYYDDDLSLAEIAENYGVSRQAALCTIRQAEDRLYGYEQKLGIVAKSDALRSKIAELSDELEAKTETVKQLLDDIIDTI